MIPARCAACEDIIGTMIGHGYGYSARQQDNEPWVVSFIGTLGRRTRRGTGATLHEAIERAVEEE